MSDKISPMSPTYPNISFFTGNNAYLLEKTLALLIENFTKKHGELNVALLESENELTANAIMSAAGSAPFLAEKRLVIIKNFLTRGEESDQAKMETRIDDMPESSLVIFYEHPHSEKKRRGTPKLAQILRKHTVVKEFNEPDIDEVTTWIINRLQKSDSTITMPQVRTIINMRGTDMLTLANEVGKLELYAAGRAITDDDIELLITKNYTATVFQFTDMLNAKDAKRAIALLHTLVEMGEEPLMLIGMIARHFRLLILVKDLMETHNIRARDVYAKMTTYDETIKPYPVKLAVEQSSKFTMAQLTGNYRALTEININFKTGRIPTLGNDKTGILLELEKFILNAMGAATQTRKLTESLR